MSTHPSSNLQQRVHTAAEQVLKRLGAVGPVELLLELRFLVQPHFDSWTREQAGFEYLQPRIHCGPEKLRQVFKIFKAWANERNLQSMPAIYQSSSRQESRELQILEQPDQALDTFYRTRFRSNDLTPARQATLEKKLNAAPELVVFIQTSDAAQCQECSVELQSGDWFCLERQQPLCLDCADLSHLEFLPSGDATLTRRAKKASPLHTVVVKFNRSRKRYERQGLLVTQQAIDEAQTSMLKDEDARAQQRIKAAERRHSDDVELVETMCSVIRDLFPSCPAEAVRRIAEHTAERGSGRVGRSAAGRAADEKAITLAVIAHIRHEHTDYDSLLMSGVDRLLARTQIRDAVQQKLHQWRSSPPHA